MKPKREELVEECVEAWLAVYDRQPDKEKRTLAESAIRRLAWYYSEKCLRRLSENLRLELERDTKPEQTDKLSAKQYGVWLDVQKVVLPQLEGAALTVEGLRLIADVLVWAAAQCVEALEPKEWGA